jgi:predicted dehydrogenase
MSAAIVGCGHIAAKHLDALANIPGVIATALCDLNEAAATKLARKFKIAGIFTDIEKMLADSVPDVVHVLTPPHTHLALAEPILAAGCHLLVEKPMTVTVSDSERIVELSAQRPGTVSVCHNFLFVPAFVAAQRLVEDGSLGALESVDVYWRMSTGGPSRRYEQTDWINDLPGGVFGEVAPHPAYLLMALLGELEVTAADVLGPTSENPTERNRRLSVQLASQSARASITLSTSAMPIEKHLRISGSQMSLIVDLGTNTLIKLRPLGHSIPGRALLNLDKALQLGFKTAVNAALALIGRMPNSHELFLRHYFACLENDAEPNGNATEGLGVVRLLDQVWSRI